MERVGQGHLKIDGLDFTPCDCNPLEPHWSIKATAADVHPGDQAWLWLPVIYVYGVPILPLPVLDVPLKPQKTGLLVTTPSHSAQNGWQVTQPVYFALAPNWDLTTSPGYTWGSSTPPAANVYTLGVKGPSLDSEVRWAHSRDTKGDIELSCSTTCGRSVTRAPSRSTRPRSPQSGSPDVLDEKRGFRGSLNGAVLQSFGDGWSAPTGPQSRLGRGAGEGHHHGRRTAGEPVSTLVGGPGPEDAGQRPLLRGHRAPGHRVGRLLGLRQGCVAHRAYGVDAAGNSFRR